jgi:methylamine--corrinoid protein Co-methyltransferase
MVSILEMYRRAQTGPIVSEKDFQVKTLLPKAEELAKEYGVVRDPEELIPTDLKLGKAILDAALVFLEERGLWCSDTSRIIKLTRTEIKDTLRAIPSEQEFGAGEDRVTIKHRDIGDKRPATNYLGAWGSGHTSAELFLKVNQSFAQEPIDMLQNGPLMNVKGRRVRINTPDEIYAVALASRLLREAGRRAGRPDMPIGFDCLAMTDIAHPAILTPGGARPTDHWTVSSVYPCSTVKLTTWNRAAWTAFYGKRFQGGSTAVLYGFSGGPETTAIVAAADAIGALMLDGNYSSVVLGQQAVGKRGSREIRWTTNAARLALSHTRTMMRAGAGSNAGSCTMQSFYQMTANRIAAEASACAIIAGAGAGDSILADDDAGLNARWVCEVGEAVTGMSLSDLHELMKILRSKYEDNLENPPKGKKFVECYDLETVTPSKEFLDLYYKAKKEIEDIGIPFK